MHSIRGLIVAGILCAGVSVHAQRDFEGVEIKVTPVAGGVHFLEGAGGNVAVLTGEDGVLMVDNQFAPLAPKIEAAIQKLQPQAPQFVINTHWHGDHTGGNEHFGRKAVIVAHDNVRKRLAGREPSAPAVALPKITHADGMTVHFNGETIRVIALGPGHTDGDSLVHFTKADVLHMGDQFFNGRFPFIDLGSGGEVAGYIRNVETALKVAGPNTRIIPGHGPLATARELREFHEMLLITTGLVKDAIREGKTLEQVKAAGLPDRWKEWGTGFINTGRWLEITYNSLQAAR